MEWQFLADFIQAVGAPVAVLMIFMYWAYRRDISQNEKNEARENVLMQQAREHSLRLEKKEDFMSAQIAELQTLYRTELVQLIRENTRAFEKFAKALERASHGGAIVNVSGSLGDD